MMIFQSFSDDVLDFEKASNMPKKIGEKMSREVKIWKKLGPEEIRTPDLLFTRQAL